MKLLALILVCALFPGVSQAQVSVFFETGGKWVGRGQVAPQSEGEMQRARCKVETILHTPGSDVQISGRCASSAGSIGFDLRLQQRENGVIAAAVVTPNLEEPTQYLGREEDEQIVLQSREPVLVQGLPYISTITISNVSPESFELHETLNSPDSEQTKDTIEMVFKIRPTE